MSPTQPTLLWFKRNIFNQCPVGWACDLLGKHTRLPHKQEGASGLSLGWSALGWLVPAAAKEGIEYGPSQAPSDCPAHRLASPAICQCLWLQCGQNPRAPHPVSEMDEEPGVHTSRGGLVPLPPPGQGQGSPGFSARASCGNL